jgi:hypothetical protein
MSYTVVVVDEGAATLVVDDPTVAPTIVEVITAGPMGPTGSVGAGLKIDSAVATVDALPATGTSGQSIYVQATGLVYTWRAA